MHSGYNQHYRMPVPQSSVPNQSPGNIYNGYVGAYTQTTNALSHMNTVLDNADIDDLKEINDDDTKLNKLLEENSEVRQMQVEREMQLASNRSLADHNLQQGPVLSQSKETLVQLYAELKQLNMQYEENKRNLESFSSQHKPDTIMALLQTKVAQSEEKSEKIAESFMSGDTTVEDFLEKYLTERNCLHIRRTKVDKLKELMKRR